MRRVMAGDEMTRITYHKEQHYHTVFNPLNGFFARIEDAGAEEPEWSADGPELLDISITNYCERRCEFCYRGSSPDGRHMAVDDFREVLQQAKDAGVLQIAFGGGNPNQHPQFTEILHLTREAGIVPSYTSNGEGLTDEILLATKRYCGAMALSAYPPFDLLEKRAKRIADYGIRLNLHVILSDRTIATATQWMKSHPDWLRYLNAIIFLNYKPINRRHEWRLSSSEALARFFDAVKGSKVKVGFDSCCISGILKWLDTPREFVESCEAARFSAFISEDLRMFPCSFMAGTAQYGELRETSLLEIWRSNPHFIAMRNARLRGECGGCTLFRACKGGCHFLPEINLCRSQRN